MRSSAPLDALVEALGRSVFALHVGREGRRYAAHLETTITSADPNRLIRRFAALVDRLPPRPRRLWDRADLREFNVGIQAAAAPASFALRLHPATVRAAARVNAAIGVTVYGAPIPATRSHRRSPSR